MAKLSHLRLASLNVSAVLTPLSLATGDLARTIPFLLLSSPPMTASIVLISVLEANQLLSMIRMRY